MRNVVVETVRRKVETHIEAVLVFDPSPTDRVLYA